MGTNLEPSARQLLAALGQYFLPVVFRRPLEIGDPMLADCIWVQAFGRRHIHDSELCEVIQRFGLQAFWDDTTMFELLSRCREFGPTGFNAGKSNFKLAKMTVYLAEKYAKDDGILPIIAQWEVVYDIWRYHSAFYLQHRDRIFVIWPPLIGENFTTLHVKSASKAVMLRKGWSRPIEVALEPMKVRAWAIINKLGVRSILAPVDNPLVDRLPDFDPKSIQYQTTRSAMWWPRELFGRYVHHWAFRIVSLKYPSPEEADTTKPRAA